MSLLAIIQLLNETPFSIYLRESELAFPLTEAIHLLGLAISVGAIMWVDLRLMGFAMRREKVSNMLSRLEPWAIFGFVVMFVSGLLLFLGKPENYYGTLAFRVKMLLLPLAGLNVLYFHKRIYPHVADWDVADAIPRPAKLVGMVSAALWIIIIVLGRWTAYFADELVQKSSFSRNDPISTVVLFPLVHISTPIAQVIKQSKWGFAILETSHILGFAILLGSVFVVNLAVLGLGMWQPAERVAKEAMRWGLVGLAIVLCTGIPMFMSAATSYSTSLPFLIKMVLLATSMVLQFAIYKFPVMYKGTLAGKIAACISLLCWFGVAYAGRAIAFEVLFGTAD